MGWRQGQVGKRISKRLSELVRESRTRVVDQHATITHFLRSIPNLLECLDSYLSRAQGLWGWRDGGQGSERTPYLYFQKPPSFFFSARNWGPIKCLVTLTIVFFKLCSQTWLAQYFIYPDPSLACALLHPLSTPSHSHRMCLLVPQ